MCGGAAADVLLIGAVVLRLREAELGEDTCCGGEGDGWLLEIVAALACVVGYRLTTRGAEKVDRICKRRCQVMWRKTAVQMMEKSCLCEYLSTGVVDCEPPINLNGSCR